MSNAFMLKDENIDDDLLSVLLHWGCKGVVVVVDTSLHGTIHNHLLQLQAHEVDNDTISSITNDVIVGVLKKFTIPKVEVSTVTLGNLISNLLFKYRYALVSGDIDTNMLNSIIESIDTQLIYLVNKVCPDIENLCVHSTGDTKFATVVNFISQKNVSIIYFAIIDQA